MTMRKVLLSALLLILTIPHISCSGGTGVVVPPPVDGRVANYTLLFDGRICRWDDSAFPLKVYIDPPPVEMGGFGPAIYQAAVIGIDMWDGVITGLPDLFNHEAGFDNADIIVRWETMNLSGYTRATEYVDRIAIHKLALSTDLRDPASTMLIMGHELGHVLGLNLSGVNGDLMYLVVNPVSTSLTQRDHDMINWLYSQEQYVPIRTY